MENVYGDVYVIDTAALPQSRSLEFKCGKQIVTMLGILIGFICIVILLLKDKRLLSNFGVILITFLALYVICSLVFITLSVLLLLATVDNDTEMMSYYIWHSMIYLCMQLVLALSIPIFLILDNKPISPIILTWLVIILIVGMGWTHFVAIVESHRMELINVASL